MGADAAQAKELAEVLHLEVVKQAYRHPLSRLQCAWCPEWTIDGDGDAYDQMRYHVHSRYVGFTPSRFSY